MTGEVRRKIDRCASGLMKYLDLLEASGQYKLRKNIRLSDVELRRYFDLMKSEILLLTVDAIAFEAFIEYAERDRNEGILQRRLVGRWNAYSAGIKDGLAVKNDRVKLEDNTDEQYYERGRQATRKSERDTEGDVAGQARTVPDPQVRKRRTGRGAASDHRAGPGKPGAPVRDPARMDHPGAR